MREIRIARKAEYDLAAASEYLDQETGNPAFGHRLHDEIDHIIDLIGENPWMGRARSELRKGLRGFPHGVHTIFWRLRGSHAVEIVRVLHQRQNLEKAFPKRPRH